MTTTIDLSGQTALVTGAGRGIGREIALTLAAAGAAVAVNDFADEDACRAVVAEIEALGVAGAYVMGDVGDEQSVADTIARVEAGLSIRVETINRAGPGARPDGALLVPADGQHGIVSQTVGCGEVNVTSLAQAIQPVAPGARPHRAIRGRP